MEFRIDHPIGNLLGWWELAGVDTLVSDENVGWLKLPEMARLRADAKKISREISPAADAMPSNLAEFLTWLETSPDVPEAAWGGERIVPEAVARADLMIISDMPDMEDMRAGALFSGRVGQLFDALLGAIGLQRESIYFCSLASTRPPGGMFDDVSMDRLSRIMRRHIALAEPKAVLLLGDKTIRILGTAETPQARQKLHILNHDNGTVRAIATFHPRFLMRQPAAKAECWLDLQMLSKEMLS